MYETQAWIAVQCNAVQRCGKSIKKKEVGPEKCSGVKKYVCFGERGNPPIISNVSRTFQELYVNSPSIMTMTTIEAMMMTRMLRTTRKPV